MSRFIHLLAVVLIVKIGNAQSISTQMGARAVGMGFASSGVTDEWSLFNNIGSLGAADRVSVAAAYELRTQRIDANRLAFAFNAPIRWGGYFRGGFPLW
jgi:hypothetical protein